MSSPGWPGCTVIDNIFVRFIYTGRKHKAIRARISAQPQLYIGSVFSDYSLFSTCDFSLFSGGTTIRSVVVPLFRVSHNRLTNYPWYLVRFDFDLSNTFSVACKSWERIREAQSIYKTSRPSMIYL